MARNAEMSAAGPPGVPAGEHPLFSFYRVRASRQQPARSLFFSAEDSEEGVPSTLHAPGKRAQ